MYRRDTGFYLNAVWTLISANFILFIACSINNYLVFFFGLMPAGLSDRPWTIVTNLFIHGNIWHILANMITLYFFGRYLLRLFGQRNFLIIYFVGGIVGNLFYYIYYILAPSLSIQVDSRTIAFGASGAVFALGGALTALRPKLKVLVFPIPVPLPLWAAVIGGFLILSWLPGVGWQAHLGGLLVGLIAGYYFRRRERYRF